MSAVGPIATLLEIERLIGRGDPIFIRSLIVMAQEDVLELEQQLIASLSENQALRERMEDCERYTRPRQREANGEAASNSHEQSTDDPPVPPSLLW